MNNYVLLEIKTPRQGEESLESMVQFLASFASIKSKKTFWKTIYVPIYLEIVHFDQSIHFYIAIPAGYQVYIESQILSQYPRSLITVLDENPILNVVSETEEVQVSNLKLGRTDFYPLKTFREFKDTDSLTPLLGMLSKLNRDDVVIIQYVLIPAGSAWQKQGQKYIEQKNKASDEDPLNLSVYAKQVSEKISYPGFHTSVRILVKSPNPSLASLVAASFANFNLINGNSFQVTEPSFWQRTKFIQSILYRSFYLASPQIMNTVELATLFHFPGKNLSTISSINWSQTILSDAPDNLPIAEDMDEEEKRNVNFFARTDFKNKSSIFGIKRVDRSKHVYIIGKTGTGKSTLIANMVINDIRNGEGVAIIDPHGDLSEIILDYVPAHRINDVVYFNPGDTEHAMHLNPLQIENKGQKELVASGIVSIFYKLYANSWGPRLEYILRNTILTLLEVPDSTLLQVPELLTNSAFRKKVVENMTDPVVKAYWTNEFEKMSDSMRNEAISPILNKVGQFLSSSLIRNIVGFPKSTIDLEDIMNNGKILIMNVSQGKIGEDNAALLGAMIITKLQLAAMNRVHMVEADRRDFYLYVDEFQNFATGSFIKILSEARKYHLNLSLANQYTAQIPPEIRSAIFGNAGTIISFLVGAEDAPILAREFGSRYTNDDLLALGNFQMLLKMSISNITSAPFFARSLPLPQNKSNNKEKVLRVSIERYAKRVEDLEFKKIETGNPSPSDNNRPQRNDRFDQNSNNRDRNNNNNYRSDHNDRNNRNDRNDRSNDRRDNRDNRDNRENRDSQRKNSNQNYHDQKRENNNGSHPQNPPQPQHQNEPPKDTFKEQPKLAPEPIPNPQSQINEQPATPMYAESSKPFSQTAEYQQPANEISAQNQPSPFRNEHAIETNQNTITETPFQPETATPPPSPFLTTPPTESQIIYNSMEQSISQSLNMNTQPYDSSSSYTTQYTPPSIPQTETQNISTEYQTQTSQSNEELPSFLTPTPPTEQEQSKDEAQTSLPHSFAQNQNYDEASQIKDLPSDDDARYPKTAEDLIKILSGNKD